MRTIKFRAFDYGKMIYENNILHLNNEDNLVLRLAKFWCNIRNDSHVMQFTGLHDKNGKEIYEGDLLGYWTKDVNKKDKLLLCRVSFINGAFVADISKNLDGKLITDLSSYLDEYVVVGNIHENPELISKTPTHEH